MLDTSYSALIVVKNWLGQREIEGGVKFRGK